jgi:hypothetical protein
MEIKSEKKHFCGNQQDRITQIFILFVRRSIAEEIKFTFLPFK